MSLSKRVVAVIAVTLAVFVATVPAAAACCVSSPSRHMASMHAPMPCCAGTCKLTKNNVRPDHEYALTTAPAVAVIAVADVVPVASSPAVSADVVAVAFASPPSFLAHHQYRI